MKLEMIINLRSIMLAWPMLRIRWTMLLSAATTAIFSIFVSNSISTVMFPFTVLKWWIRPSFFPLFHSIMMSTATRLVYPFLMMIFMSSILGIRVRCTCTCSICLLSRVRSYFNLARLYRTVSTASLGSTSTALFRLFNL